MTKIVVMSTKGLVDAIQGKDVASADLPPPGLLLSLGDGSAVECTAEMFKQAVENTRPMRSLPLNEWFATFARCLIQQAQEARDAVQP